MVLRIFLLALVLLEAEVTLTLQQQFLLKVGAAEVAPAVA
jgi:hypothetical protein